MESLESFENRAWLRDHRKDGGFIWEVLRCRADVRMKPDAARVGAARSAV